MMISQEIVPEISEKIKPSDFYRDAHRKVYGAILSLYSRGEPVDPVTVSEELKQQGALESIGGVSFLHTLYSAVPTSANARYYSQIIEKNSILRMLIKAGTEIVQLGYEFPEDIIQTIDAAEQTIFEISKKKISEQFSPIKDLLIECWEEIENLYEKKSLVTGISTGFADVDRLTSGLHKSDLIIIAARPSMGKTSLALNIARNVGLSGDVSVAIFSLEMSKMQIMLRLLCAEAGIDAQALRTGRLKEDEWTNFAQAVDKLSKANVWIDDTPGITMMETRAKARRLATKTNLGLIIVDYLQLMSGDRRFENKTQEVTDISRSLKVMARELNVPVIAISQLSREVEKRGKDRRPMLSDLRESGAIEQDADLVIFIYRDEYYDKESEDQGKAEIHLAKHRNGPIGKVELTFLQQYATFRNLYRE